MTGRRIEPRERGPAGGEETERMPDRRSRRRTAELTLQLEHSTLAERLREGEGKRAALLVIGGIDMGGIIPLERDSTLLGRDPACDGVVRDDGISRRHAEVRRRGDGGYVLVDLDSTNGVFVDGGRVAEHELREGDKVLLGRRTVLQFVLQDPFEEQFRAQMYESTVRDPLTGAYNRKHFDERFEAELSYARRHGAPLTLLIFDLDHFKRINDTYGHPAGDQVLQAVVAAVSDRLRSEDLLARYGGEEFTVVARGITDIGGLALGERLRREVEELRVLAPDGERIPVTISVGAATVPGESGAGADAVLALADENLYEAKRRGRNQVVAKRVEQREDSGVR